MTTSHDLSLHLTKEVYASECAQEAEQSMLLTLKERIDDLCKRAIATPPSPELDALLVELKRALHEHNEKLRDITAESKRYVKP